MIQPDPVTGDIVNRANLRKLARLWSEGRTGQVRDAQGTIDLIRGEVADHQQVRRLMSVVYGQEKLRFRERSLPGFTRPLLGESLFRAAMECVNEQTLRPENSIEPGEAIAHIDQLPVSEETYAFYERQDSLESLIRLPAEARARVRHELAALVLLGVYRRATHDPDEQERIWLKAEFRRLAQIPSSDPRAVVGVGSAASKDQVHWLARRKVERCMELRKHPSQKVRQVALQVAGAIIDAAKRIDEVH